MTTFFFLALGLLAVAGVVATLTEVLRDGYRRAPTSRPALEYQQSHHYRA